MRAYRIGALGSSCSGSFLVAVASAILAVDAVALDVTESSGLASDRLLRREDLPQAALTRLGHDDTTKGHKGATTVAIAPCGVLNIEAASKVDAEQVRSEQAGGALPSVVAVALGARVAPVTLAPTVSPAVPVIATHAPAAATPSLAVTTSTPGTVGPASRAGASGTNGGAAASTAEAPQWVVPLPPAVAVPLFMLVGALLFLISVGCAWGTYRYRGSLLGRAPRQVEVPFNAESDERQAMPPKSPSLEAVRRSYVRAPSPALPREHKGPASPAAGASYREARRSRTPPATRDVGGTVATVRESEVTL